MADVRINALATTATSSASDDYIAIDGSANGTRKLSVYSPTFGGNLTVSGTGTSSVAGNLTVSGGTTTLADSNGSFGTLTGAYNAGNQFVRLNRIGNTEYVGLFADNTIRFVTNSAEAARFVTSGNLLLGTTTDSANGRIQLASHTTSAGGIGFGTDVSLYRPAANVLALDSGDALRLGNAYVAGAPTATGYITIQDSTGTTYKIPAVAA